MATEKGHDTINPQPVSFYVEPIVNEIRKHNENEVENVLAFVRACLDVTFWHFEADSIQGVERPSPETIINRRAESLTEYQHQTDKHKFDLPYLQLGTLITITSAKARESGYNSFNLSEALTNQLSI